MKKFLWTLIILIVIGVGLRFVSQKTNLLNLVTINTGTQEQTQIANPASVNCTQKGGTSEIVTNADESQSGLCHLTDGTTCDEWAYFRGECPAPVVEAKGIIETSGETTNPINQENATSQINSSTNEFSINDSKYEISPESTKNLFDLMTASALVENTDPKCMMDNPKAKAYQDKLTYYTNILNMNKDIQAKIYLIKDTTLAGEYEQNPSMYGGYGINIYVMPNKVGYTNKEDFIKDFTRYCSIRPWIPIAISKNYLIFSDSCDNGAMEVLGCDEKTINDIQNKIIVN